MKLFLWPMAASICMIFFLKPEPGFSDSGSAPFGQSEPKDVGKVMAPKGPRILIIGDSLTEGYGVAPEASYPALLQEKLRSAGKMEAEVVNAGTAGATSAFGLRTLKFQTKYKNPDLLIVALGANDGLRGISTKETEKNLREILSLAKQKSIKTLLIGMMAPPNYGRKFPEEFAAIYPKLAREFGCGYIPFLLDGVAAVPELNLSDGIHPNEKGYEVIARNLFSQLQEYLK